MKGYKSGFTLVETLVALAVFSVVMVVSGGIVLSLISSNRQNQSVNSVVNNLSYSIESMVRDIKTGYSYKCDYPTGNINDYVKSTFKNAPHTCTVGASIDNISLISNITGQDIVVRYDFIAQSGGNPGYIKKTVYSEQGGVINENSYPLTDTQNIDMTDVRFRVDPGKPLYQGDITNSDASQPSVFVMMKGTAKVNAVSVSDFFMQTFISQRLPNFI